ncbi:hypothetical protein [Sulfobacillus sp. hq2]|uniref:hypothetical protein n=1 Tax=Sulfobacillus sp. hq2 TaxID=2039167 RepID=UPI000CD02C45|nr:hypothetical protein [Sulfobacillus sp. hq2]POB12164.1 hypothetical protein CO251_00630 [Sulfobacillus sp. hq2]
MSSPLLPAVILCDGDTFEADRLLAALRDAAGTQPRLFVKDHATLPETLVVLLPPDGPSLAAVLRDWVRTWWSDADAARSGTPEQYLAGFGVVLDPDPYATFSTSCPYCGADGTLSVVSGVFATQGVAVHADGFALDTAAVLHTADEMVACAACQRTFAAADIAL